MMMRDSIARVGLAALLWLQAIAPFVHLAGHAAGHADDHATGSCTAHDRAELVTQHEAHHACATCQWMTGNPGLTGGWHHMDVPARAFAPRLLEPATTPAHPAFDFNVAVARGPPALSVDLV